MKMKKLLSLALALALCLGLTVPAHAAGDFDIIDGVLVRYYGSGSKVVIPDGVTAIDGLTFAGCETVTSVMIPASVTKIEASAFSFADGLTSIEVDPSNPNYTSVDGVLFSRDKTLLVQYPCSKAGSSYAVPDGVTRIYGYAFYGCQNLTGISLPAVWWVLAPMLFGLRRGLKVWVIPL